jgi:hypothetical protein
MDGSKPSIPCHGVGARIDLNVEPISVDVRHPADLSGTLDESSMIAYCGDDEQVRQGFMLALRAMGIETNLPEEIENTQLHLSRGALYCWHTLTVRAKDNEFVVSLDGIWMFTAFDRTLSQAGRIALWAQGDGVTRFDSIAITPLAAAEERY